MMLRISENKEAKAWENQTSRIALAGHWESSYEKHASNCRSEKVISPDTRKQSWKGP